ncbi:MAG: DsbA family protein [Alphaproteobacteria bacterium]
MIRRLIALSLGLVLAASVGASAQDKKAFTPQQSQEVERIVREYLSKHPEIIYEAVKTLEAREQAQQAENAKAAIEKFKDKLVNNSVSPVLGNPKGDVTVVEFFDYQCPYCRKVVEPTFSTVAKDGKIRYVLKELPILGPESTYAAKASLAAHKQGKYREFHLALMEQKTRLSEAVVMAAAEKLGLDTKRLKRDMEAAEVEEELKQNLELARALRIDGTPAFIVGGQMAPGAIDGERLATMVKDARKS